MATNGKPESYSEAVQAAIRDFTEHGYDSSERLRFWTKRIKDAADASLDSQADLTQALRANLAGVYRDLIEREGALSRHPGIQRFTIDRVKPKLRNALDRRIMASADLIRLNREQKVAQTLQRFSGWATSIPAGGSDTVDKRAEVKQIKRGMARLPFEERRVLIDQGHKLAASINQTIAEGGGAIAMEWHSRWRQAGYDYREDHKERDTRVYLLKESWAREQGLVKPGPDGFYEDITAVAEEPFCRCFATWKYALRALPPAMITKKGAAELARVRADIERLAAT